MSVQAGATVQCQTQLRRWLQDCAAQQNEMDCLRSPGCSDELSRREAASESAVCQRMTGQFVPETIDVRSHKGDVQANGIINLGRQQTPRSSRSGHDATRSACDRRLSAIYRREERSPRLHRCVRYARYLREARTIRQVCRSWIHAPVQG